MKLIFALFLLPFLPSLVGWLAYQWGVRTETKDLPLIEEEEEDEEFWQFYPYMTC